MEAPDLIGIQLGPYKVQALIGSGGMARVYRGFDEELQRPVAIKVLSDVVAQQPGFTERFRQEARLIANLHHPHIVQVYTFGQQEQHTYMVQELLPGPTLERYLCMLATQEKWLSRQDVVSVVSQLASALDAAHIAGIVHRDVKPSNALWNAAGALVLTDFGVARNILTDRHATRTGMIIGTPYYLSPEQARGFPGVPASDIYALGILVYELITGRVPFVGDEAIDIIRQHIQASPPPLHTLRSGMPPAVEEVLQRALAKNPTERFENAGALAHALRRAWPPVYERDHRVLPGRMHHQNTSLWATFPLSTPPQPGSHRNGLLADLHAQTTVISNYEFLDMLLHTSCKTPGEHVPRSTPSQRTVAPDPDAASPTRARPRRWPLHWHVLTLIPGTLLLIMIMIGSVLALQDDYEELAQTSATAASVELIAPTSTAVPTARIAVPTRQPTPTRPLPTATPAPPTLQAVAGVDNTEATASTEPRMPTAPGVVATNSSIQSTEPISLSEQFADLRVIIENQDTGGWARIDRGAWLARLDAIQREVEAGNTERAAAWLQEVRQTVLRNTRDGTMTPDVARQVIANIDSIALSTGMTLPPLTDDS
jgi:serine/threonine-protein kinase